MRLEIAGVPFGGKVFGFIFQEVAAIVFSFRPAIDEEIIDPVQLIVEVAINPGA